MTNTTQKPTAEVHNEVTYKDENVKIIAESFNEPIRQAESLALFTRVRFLRGTIEVGKTTYYEPQMDLLELTALLKEVKENIEKFFQ